MLATSRSSTLPTILEISWNFVLRWTFVNGIENSGQKRHTVIPGDPKKRAPNFPWASFLKLPFKLNGNPDTTTLLYVNIMPKHDVDQSILVYFRAFARDDHHPRDDHAPCIYWGADHDETTCKFRSACTQASLLPPLTPRKASGRRWEPFLGQCARTLWTTSCGASRNARS